MLGQEHRALASCNAEQKWGGDRRGWWLCLQECPEQACGTGCQKRPTLNESSMFSPPQTSSPESYVPSSKKYLFSMENKPPAITGHLQQAARCRSGGQNAPISFTKGSPRNRAVRCLGTVCGFALTAQTLGPILLVPTDKGNIKNSIWWLGLCHVSQHQHRVSC